MDRCGRLVALWMLLVGFWIEQSHAFTACRPQARLSIPLARSSFHPNAHPKQHSSLKQAVNGNSESRLKRFHLFRRLPTRRRVVNKLRRALAVFWTVALLWMGGAALHVAPSHASTTVAPTKATINRVIPKGPSLDKIVDRYVKDHMFDDDVYDPVESAFREAHDDVTTGNYPRELNQVASGLLGSSALSSEKPSRENVVISLLNNFANGLQKVGLSEVAANVVVYATSLIGVPSLVLIGILSYANLQKRMINRQNKRRYGDDYSLDATIKIEEEVEAPDEDDFEDEDEDDEDEDDEDEDDDDE